MHQQQARRPTERQARRTAPAREARAVPRQDGQRRPGSPRADEIPVNLSDTNAEGTARKNRRGAEKKKRVETELEARSEKREARIKKKSYTG